MRKVSFFLGEPGLPPGTIAQKIRRLRVRLPSVGTKKLAAPWEKLPVSEATGASEEQGVCESAGGRESGIETAKCRLGKQLKCSFSKGSDAAEEEGGSTPL